MLHITNGDLAGAVLAGLGAGEVLPWRDARCCDGILRGWKPKGDWAERRYVANERPARRETA